MKKNILLVGAGYFAQRVHIPTIKKFNKDLKIFIFDERKKLAKLVGTKFNLLVTDELNQKFIQKNKIQNALVCYPKEKSYYFSKKLLKLNINVLCEKPAAYNMVNIKQLLSLAKKKKKIFRICYQKNFFTSVKFIKNNLRRLIKKYGDITHIHFELFNGDMRQGTRSFRRTKEKITNKSIDEKIKGVPKKFEINYKIFTNRYIHSINLFNSIFDISKSEPKLNFKIISRTDYILNLLFKKKNVTFLFGDYNYNSWHDQLTIFFKKAKIDLSMVAPLNFKNKTKLIFYDGIEKKNKNIELKKIIFLKINLIIF